MNKMIKSVIAKFGLALLLSMGISNVSWAYLITEGTTTTDVGVIDTLIQVATKTNPADPVLSLTNMPSSAEQMEIDWVNLVLNTSFTSNNYKLENASFALVDDSTSIYASALNVTPSTAIANYFIVKNSTTWALFGNNVEMGWAVFDASVTDLAGLNYNSNEPADPWIISHLTVFSSTSVPEPSILALMGLGLLGVVFTRRRKLNA